MKLAIAQIISSTDPQENLATIDSQVAAAAGQGARLVVFPEGTMCSFAGNIAAAAEPLDGPWAGRVRDIAAAAGVTVVAGMFTPATGGKVRNTLLATGNGVEAAYDKIHMYDAFGFAESDSVTPGDEPVTIDVDGVTVGLTTCYDVRFPGLYQTLGDRGASVITVSASWGAGPTKREQWDLLVRARAIDSTAYIAACDQADPASVGIPVGKAPTGVGGSAVVGPLGAVREHLDTEPGLLVADVDVAEVETARKAVPVLANRRF